LTVGRRSFAIESRELWQRIGVTFGALAIYWLGTHLPLPGLDLQVLNEAFGGNAGGRRGALDVFSGAAFGRLSIFALGIGPYITASFYVLLLTAVSRRLRKRQVDRNDLDWFARIGAAILAAIGGYAVAVGLESAGGVRSLVAEPGAAFRLVTMATLVTGAVFLMWLAEQITQRGIGNGVALILFTDIVARLPREFARLIEMGRTGALPSRLVVPSLALAAVAVAVIVFMEGAQRRVLVQYRARLIGTMMFEGEGAYLGFNLNNFGIIPAIFASSFLLVPAGLVAHSADQTGWREQIMVYLGHGTPAYLACYAGLIVVLAFLYTALLFNPTAMAERLRSYGGTISGHEPGRATADYFDQVLTRLTLVGAVYVAGICLLPEVLISQYNVPFYFGGTSLLILVSVALDLLRQIRAYVGVRV